MDQQIVPQVFSSDQFGEVRALKDDSGPLFVLKDIMAPIGLTNTTKAVSGLEEDEFTTIQLTDALGRTQGTYVITEAGLYSLVLKSRKPEARAFKRWVTHEVLPAIRRDGGYMVARAGETPEETMARAVLIAQRTIERQDATIERQRAAIRELAPKAAFFDAVGDADGKMSVADFSKALRQSGIRMGQNRLFRWFRDNGYMGKRGVHRNRPTQRTIDQGLFYLHDTTFVRGDGKVFNSFTPMITAKGATAFFRRISGQRQMSMDM